MRFLPTDQTPAPSTLLLTQPPVHPEALPHCFSCPLPWFLSAHPTPSLISQHPINCFIPFLFSCSQLVFFQSCTHFTYFTSTYLHVYQSQAFSQAVSPIPAGRTLQKQGASCFPLHSWALYVLFHYHLDGHPVKSLPQPCQSQQTIHMLPGEFFG